MTTYERISLRESLLNPRSVAIIGASTNPEALGGRPIGFLESYGYAGTVYPVNLNNSVVQGIPAYASIKDLPEPVDVAMVAVRAELVPDTLRDCAEAGVGMAIVISSGFGEGTGRGATLTELAREAVTGTGLRVLGPNCEGLATFPSSAPVTFSPVLDIHRSGGRLASGGISIISQSGGLGFAAAQWGKQFGLGYNTIVTTGNEMDIDAVEIAEVLLDDPQTKVLVLIIEGVRDLDRFAAVAHAYRAAGKPLVVVKMGRSEAGSRGALAHTRHHTGDDDAYARIFADAGVIEASGMEELIDVLQAVTKAGPARGNRVGIVTTSGGAGVWLADTCADLGLEVPTLSEATRATLAAHMPAYGSPANPVDLTAQFLTGGSFAPPLYDLAASGEVDMIVLSTSLASDGRLSGDRGALAEVIAESTVPIVIITYTRPAPSAVEILEELSVPWYTDPGRAARGLRALAGRMQHS